MPKSTQERLQEMEEKYPDVAARALLPGQSKQKIVKYIIGQSVPVSWREVHDPIDTARRWIENQDRTAHRGPVGRDLYNEWRRHNGARTVRLAR